MHKTGKVQNNNKHRQGRIVGKPEAPSRIRDSPLSPCLTKGNYRTVIKLQVQQSETQSFSNIRQQRMVRNEQWPTGGASVRKEAPRKNH